MPSKLGPHFIGTPGLERWIAAGARVFKFDPSSLGASTLIPPGPLVIGKLDQREDRLNLTDWKAYKNQGWSPQQTAAHRFDVQRTIYVGANKPRVNRYEANGRIDVWEDDNEVVPDNPQEAQWYATYCIEMMKLYESIGKRRANFCFAVGTPDIRPNEPSADVWPHLIPAVQHAHDHGHYIALHEYMGYEADLGVGWKQIDGQKQRIQQWHGRRRADGQADESYPYGYVVLRYRHIYDAYFRPHNLHTTPLLITELGCDSVETVTPAGLSVGTWKEHQGQWAAEGKDPELHYAAMLRWYDQRIREDEVVRGAMVFTVGSVGNWANWDISGTRVEENLLHYIAAEQGKVDTPLSTPDDIPPMVEGNHGATAAGFSAAADLNQLAPGQLFQATWRFRNTGTTTWDSNYLLVYTKRPHPETNGLLRSQMGAAWSKPITALGAAPQVRPGETADLTLTLKAPAGAGMFGANWQLQAPDGTRFGALRWLRVVVFAEHQPGGAGG
jgi:hypothetical protein